MSQNALAEPDRSANAPPGPSGLEAFLSMLTPCVLPRLQVLILANNNLEQTSDVHSRLVEQMIAALKDGCLPNLGTDVPHIEAIRRELDQERAWRALAARVLFIQSWG